VHISWLLMAGSLCVHGARYGAQSVSDRGWLLLKERPGGGGEVDRCWYTALGGKNSTVVSAST
jgi:hypothetical protein